MFFYESGKIFKNTFLIEHLWATTYDCDPSRFFKILTNSLKRSRMSMILAPLPTFGF